MDSAYQFYVEEDCSSIYKHQIKIQRMYNVKLMLGEYVVGGGQWVGVQGEPGDRRNAKIYVLALVGQKNYEEQIVFLPPIFDDDDFEDIEKQSLAVITPGDEQDQFVIIGTNMSITMAVTLFEEFVTNEIDEQTPEATPIKPKSNKASRRLSTALQQTLQKKNRKMGNCSNASDAVKRAIMSCLQDPDEFEVEKDSTPTENINTDGSDVILIDDDSEDDVMTIENDDDDDDDVMIIETPRRDQTAKQKHERKDENAFKDLSEAFRTLRTPSKSDEEQTSPAKPIVAVKPMSKSEKAPKQTKEKILFQVKKKTDKFVEVKHQAYTNVLDTMDMSFEESSDSKVVSHKGHNHVLRKGEVFFSDISESYEMQEIKRQKVKSVVVNQRKDDIELEKPNNAGDNRVTKAASKVGRFNDNEADECDSEDTVRDQLENQLAVRQSSKRLVRDYMKIVRTPSRTGLRYVVIDGSNVAMSHSDSKNVFSCKGILICVEYFMQRGHDLITVFLPHWRKGFQPHWTVTDRYILNDLEKDGFLVYTPSRKIGNKLVASYDDRFIIELAEREDGVIVSNDQYRDLMREKYSWKKVIEERLLMFSFVRDHFMVPEDPLGQHGPSLTEFLRHKKPSPQKKKSDRSYSKQKGLRGSAEHELLSAIGRPTAYYSGSELYMRDSRY